MSTPRNGTRRILSGGTGRERLAQSNKLLKGNRLSVSNAWQSEPPAWVRFIILGRVRFADVALRAQQCCGENYFIEYLKKSPTPRGWSRKNYEDRVEELLKKNLWYCSTHTLFPEILTPVVLLGLIVVGLVVSAAAGRLLPETSSSSPLLVITATLAALLLTGTFGFLAEGRWTRTAIIRTTRAIEMCGVLACLAVIMQWISTPTLISLALGFASFAIVGAVMRLGSALLRPIWVRRNATIMPALLVGELARIYHSTVRHRNHWPDVELTKECVTRVKNCAKLAGTYLPMHLGDAKSIPFNQIAGSLRERYLGMVGDVASGGGRKRLEIMSLRDLPFVVAGQWAELATRGQVPISVQNDRKKRGLRRTIVALAPLTAALCIRAFNLLPSEQTGFWLAVGILWPAVVVILTIEPDAKKYVELITQIRSALKAESKESSAAEDDLDHSILRTERCRPDALPAPQRRA